MVMNHILFRMAVLTCFLITPLLNGTALALDISNCLMCHRHRGLSYIDENDKFRLLYITEAIYQNSPHGLFNCRDCHDDINEIPHKKAQKVNCMKECHLKDTMIPFSHTEIGDLIAESVHSPVDAQGNYKLYQEDYPTCKTCH